MTAMKLNFKTLDNKSFSLTVNENEDLVEDLISRIEDKFGRENLYKLIFAGKLLKEEDPLSKYKLKSKIPIIVMITHSPNIIIDNSKEDKKSATEESTGSSRRGSLEPACFKRVRTVTEDSGIEEDIAEDHFITDTELDSVIEIILSCPYLTEDSATTLTEPEIVRTIDKYCVDSEVDVDFWDILTVNIGKIVSARLNKSQLMALLEDARDIFEEPRQKHNTQGQDKKHEEDLDRDMSDFEDEEVPEVIAPTMERPDSPSNKSLDFLRDIEEFQFLRYQVLHDPLLLQPLLLSFSQSHPDIMKIINENKETFIRMLYEQTGAKLTGRH